MKSGLAGIITGASTGIGRALAVLLAKEFKARLVLTARSEDKLSQVVSSVKQAGGEALLVSGDIADRALAESLPPLCLEKFEALDLVVNNAGLGIPGPIQDLTPEDWERHFQVNFFAPLYITYAALPHFLEKKRGKIVNVSSVAGKVAYPGSVCYAASKFALTGMSEGMAAELGRKGIDVITVCPGWVRSEFFAKNNVADRWNPTLIAERPGPAGWLMKHCLSISSEECARQIVLACSRGGGREIVLTAPGVLMERLAGLCPSLVHTLVARLSPES